MHSSPDFVGLQSYMQKRLKDELPSNLLYHNLDHTEDVVESIVAVASGEGVTVEEDILLLKTAALMHDSGFLNSYDDHEIKSCELADAVLPEYGYSTSQIDNIKKLILATRMPQNPTSHLEEIICDADLDYLGREDYDSIAEGLFLELKSMGKVVKREEWIQIQSDFLSNHTYWTKYSKKSREKLKQLNLSRIINNR